MIDPILEAIEAVLAGELIIIPTDTVYGIAARPDDPRATGRLFTAKGRSPDLSLPVLVSSVEEAQAVAAFDDRALALASAFWPGPLTLVLRRSASSSEWDLGQDSDTIAVRVPRQRLAAAVLAGAGPLAVSSANLSGEPTPEDCEALNEVFKEAVGVYLCLEGPLSGAASTVLDLTEGRSSILRAGDIDEAAIAGVLGE